MPLSRDDISFKADLPDLGGVMPVTRFQPPCLKDAQEQARAFAEALGIGIRATVSVPHGLMAAGDDGQVEFFAASGALRGRNTAMMARYDDERRDWPDLEKFDGPDGVDFRLGPDAAGQLLSAAHAVLERAGIEPGRAAFDRVALERWAQLDEKGNERDAGPGRATVQYVYTVAGVPLLGPGAKTNMHYDPADRGGTLVRFFHVNRPHDEVAEVRTAPLELALDGLLTEQWRSTELNPGDARIVVTAATVGLLAFPAHIPQSHALPVLAVEGVVQGDLDGLEEIHFAKYLPAFDEKHAAELGFAPVVETAPGEVVSRPPRLRKDVA